MRKKILTLVAAAAMTLAMSVMAFAAGWVQDSTGWWYGTNADNTTWYSNGWQWIDGNGDGVAECYYFDGNGYIAANTTTPDGYQVDANGAWTVNGVVQTQATGAGQGGAAYTGTAKSAEEILDYLENRDDGKTVFAIDYSKEPVASGATNIKNKYGEVNCWEWIPCKYINGATLYCPVAFDENGYLLVNTTTPDGYYVNEYGILTIDGIEVVHAGECRNFPYKLDTTDIYGNIVDKNNCDLSTIDLGATTHSLYSDAGAQIPFGRLMYMHVESQQPDGTFAPGLGFNSCAQIYKEFYPNSYGADVGPEPATFR